ncbi:sugar ABC transporter substrate-binding protein [Lentzea jiangxiensis]|uniref:Multiple sugar transport system substrate-binding protein n=1 Tax=Lentzea jiangxiensis TaxID=641025 RepID=A0A1H0W5I0_9PSEU|nr:sugar ABC transporter substrate-binding protein [Lentzea jiangxiensis]SDP85745.1 multiple sugar transport system substrate-binding protein [Lentzea jiangxiensis]
MRRRTAATIATLSVAALLAGCGSTVSSAEDPNKPLEVWTRSTEATAEVYEKIFESFTEKTGVRVDYKPIFNDFDKQVQQRAASQDLPDVVITDTGSLGDFVKQSWTTEVKREDVAGGADIVDRAWGNGKGADGKFYAIPCSTQALVTLIRKDWREKLGKPVPTTWEELDDLAKAFTRDDPDGNGQNDTYGMLVPGTTDRGYLAWWASSYIWQGGGDILEEEGDGKFRVGVDSPESTKAVERLRKLFCEEKVVQPGSLTLGTNDAHPLFESGKSGIYLTGPYMIGRFDKSVGEDRYEVIASPRGPAGAAVLGEGENIYRMAGSAKTADQKKLAEYLITAEAQQAGMKGDPQPVVRLPVNKTVDVDATYNDPRWATVAGVYRSEARPFPSVPNFAPFRQKTSETLNSLFAKCPADSAAELRSLADALEKELENQKASK